MGEITVATLIASAGTVFSTAIEWVGTVASTITGNAFLMLACVAVPLCGLGVGMLKRLISTRA